MKKVKSIKSVGKVNLLKVITLLIGTIVLFIAIQRPESTLNKKLSQETINMERAKLLLEVRQNNNNPEEILFDFSVIEKSYPSYNNL